MGDDRLLPTPSMMDGTRVGKANDPEHWEQRRKQKAEQGINLHDYLSVAMPRLAAEQADTSASSAASEDLTSPSKPSSGTSQQPSLSGMSPASESLPGIGLGFPSSETSESSDLPLLPTPAVNDMGANKTVEWWDEWAIRQKAADGRPAPHGRSLAIEAARLAEERFLAAPRGSSSTENANALLPTPTSQASKHGELSPYELERGDTGNLWETVGFMVMLPTPRTTDGTAAPANRSPYLDKVVSGEDGRTPRLSEMALYWGAEPLISSAEDFPARTYPQQASAMGSRGSDQASSTNSPELYLTWDRDTSCWRTSEDFSQQTVLFQTPEDRLWPKSQERWPTSGSLVSTGSCWVLQTLAHPTAVTAYSSSPQLHTPTSTDKDGRPRWDKRASPESDRNKPVANLMAQIVEMLPTPTANEDSYRIGGESQQSKSLSGMARRGELGSHGEPTTPRSDDGKP